LLVIRSRLTEIVAPETSKHIVTKKEGLKIWCRLPTFELRVRIPRKAWYK
jgi:hypothetical protein